MCKKQQKTQVPGVVLDLLIEDYRLCHSYCSAIGKLFSDERKKYESSLAFHKRKIDEIAIGAKIKIVDFEGVDYNEGLPITPLNAEEFTGEDCLYVCQTIEPTIVNFEGETLRQGTVILAKKYDQTEEGE